MPDTAVPAILPSDDAHAIMERVLIHGDLSKLTPEERCSYYMQVCSSVGLNPLTRPLEYVRLSGKEVLYAKRDCADQLRRIHGISVEITDKRVVDGLMMVEVRATDKHGRVDSDLGVVPVGGLKGESLANAMLKAVTKAKRRVTLSISGLGFLDETEVESVQQVEAPEPPPPAPTRPVAQIEVDIPGASPVYHPRTRRGLADALDTIEQHSPGAVVANCELLDLIAEKLPDLADRVAEVRAAAAEALTPAGDEPPTGADRAAIRAK